jgi:hypothetical protein
MSFFKNVVVEEVTGAAIEKFNNELTFANFVEQAPKHNIITVKTDENCKSIKNKMNHTISKKDIYLLLYDYLVKKEVIKSEFSIFSLWTGFYVNKIDKEKIKISNLNNLFCHKKENAIDYPHELKCCTINCDQLHKFLSEYKNNPTNELHLGAKIVHNTKKEGGNKTKKKKSIKKTF